MKLSPLQLSTYFVTDLRLKALLSFDPKQDVAYDPDAFSVKHSCMQVEVGNSSQWQVDLTVKQYSPKGLNVPYTFSITVVGYFIFHPEFPESKIEQSIKTTAPSILYGLVREIIQTLCNKGPYEPVLVPAVSFNEPNAAKTIEAQEAESTK